MRGRESGVGGGGAVAVPRSEHTNELMCVTGLARLSTLLSVTLVRTKTHYFYFLNRRFGFSEKEKALNIIAKVLV